MLPIQHELTCHTHPTIHMERQAFLLHTHLPCTSHYIAKARSEVVFDIQKLKPGGGQEHIYIVLLHNVDVSHDGQHSYESTHLQGLGCIFCSSS